MIPIIFQPTIRYIFRHWESVTRALVIIRLDFWVTVLVNVVVDIVAYTLQQTGYGTFPFYLKLVIFGLALYQFLRFCWLLITPIFGFQSFAALYTKSNMWMFLIGCIGLSTIFLSIWISFVELPAYFIALIYAWVTKEN